MCSWSDRSEVRLCRKLQKGHTSAAKLVPGAEGLPTAFVQDHFRQVVKPSYTNVFRERNGVLGVVEFDTREDLDRAIR